ncbi:hypothetical protein FRB97_000719 [Tulasnella sp. 331]|nr:hypothetical protein FRB97_000719 [Tulasnella sp. 331]KAG8887217.1 hypothetical protein FRB98_000379 [Tulasnella sp. 332]
MDHSDPSLATTTLSLTVIRADPSLGSRLGSLYTNYGGPNVPGAMLSLMGFGESIHSLVGGRYDVYSWDPRGIGRTTPAVNCYGSANEQKAALLNTVAERTFSITSDPWSKEGRAVLVQQQREALAIWQMQATICNQTMGVDVLKYMGTTTLIKDMEYLKNAIDGLDAPINFHGGSYGTIVADYLVNMLPHRVGKVIAHGVADPVMWATKHFETYAWLNDLLEDAEDRVENFLEMLHDSGGMRVTGPAGVRRGLLTSGMVRASLFETLQYPATWQSYTEKLALALGIPPSPPGVQNLAPLFAQSIQFPLDIPAGAIGQEDLTRLAVSCADAIPYDKDEEWPTAEGMVDALLAGALKTTRTFGGTVHLLEQHGGCQFWPKSDTIERFSGPWNHTLQTPMLVVSNSHDPITPASQGRKMASRFGDSARHVVQNGTGHSYLVQPTDCYAKIVKGYFEEGKIPNHETFCNAPEADNFPELGARAEGDAAKLALLPWRAWKMV